MRTVDILGQEYRIIDDDTLFKEGFDGLAGSYDKVIRVRPLNELLGSSDDITVKKKYRRELLRHEIIHCFFRESGLERWQNDEDLVTWISIMFPKMDEVFSEIGCSS